MNPINMPHKELVLTRYPQASAEQESTGEWGVWDINEEERKRLDDKYHPARHGRSLLGLGKTEAEAWAAAVRSIERQEGIQLLTVHSSQLANGKWYWVRYEGMGKTYEAPAMYRSEANAFYSVEFSGIPARQVLVLRAA